MKITRGNIKVGMTIAYVRAFNDNRKINNTVINEYEVLKIIDDVWIRLKTLPKYIKANFDKEIWERNSHHLPGVEISSMNDMGIIPNNYNNHQTFDSIDAAKQYICNFTGVNFQEPPADNYDRAMKVLDL